jgi:hypothetical protein
MPKTIINSFSPTANFWKNNPQLTIHFKKFYDDDTTKDKERSSKIMWAIAFLVDPNENNTFRNMKYNDKLEVLKTNYLNEKNFSWLKYDSLIETYKQKVLTISELALHVLNRKLEERINLINDTPLNLQNAELIDKIQLNTTKIKKEIKDFERLLKEEDSSTTTKGNKKISLLDSGDLN